MLKEGKVCIPKDKMLRVEIIWLHHGIPVAEHKKKIEDDRVGNKKLLVARSNQRYGGICK